MTQWDNVSKEAKQRKLDMKKSKRDIQREEKIKELGGEAITVMLGKPLDDVTRKERLEVFYDLLFPNRRSVKSYANKVKVRSEMTEVDCLKRTFKRRRLWAKKNKVVWDIEFEDVPFTKTCPALGIEMVVGDGVLHDGSPTLDRKDPNKGYVKGNVSWLSHKANRIKNNATAEELLKVYEYVKGL